MKARKGFKRLEHTADEYIMAYGSNLEEAFESAALAMFEVMTDTRTVEPRNFELIEVEAGDEASLLYAWLEELLIKVDSEEQQYSKFNVKKIEKRGKKLYLKATICGEPYKPEKHPSRTGVKAITYHRMEIFREPHKVTVKFILDV